MQYDVEHEIHPEALSRMRNVAHGIQEIGLANLVAISEAPRRRLRT